MRFLADENFPGSAVTSLRHAGHDVVWVRTDAPPMPDDEIFEWAVREARVVLTFDKDFGEIAQRARHVGESGVILFRISMTAVKQFNAEIADLIASRSDWHSSFAVVEAGHIRMKPLIIK